MNKDNNYTTQIQRVFRSFYDSPKTMKEVDAETGIMRENICRHVQNLFDEGKIYKVGARLCKITKYKAGIYTTNPDLIFKNYE